MKRITKNMTILITVYFIFGLCGCAGQIEGYEVRLAVKYCEDKGGVDYLFNKVAYGVRCNNGSIKRYTDLRAGKKEGS